MSAQVTSHAICKAFENPSPIWVKTATGLRIPRGGIGRKAGRRLAAGRELVDLARRGQRVEQQQTVAVVDRIGRDHLVPILSRLPVGMRCLPVPQACLKLAHRGMLDG